MQLVLLPPRGGARINVLTWNHLHSKKMVTGTYICIHSPQGTNQTRSCGLAPLLIPSPSAWKDHRCQCLVHQPGEKGGRVRDGKKKGEGGEGEVKEVGGGKDKVAKSRLPAVTLHNSEVNRWIHMPSCPQTVH